MENTKFVQFHLHSSSNYPSTYGNYWYFSNNFLWPSDSPIKSVRFIELIPTHWWMPFEKTLIHHDNTPDNHALEITSSASSASSSTMHHYVHIQCAFVRMKTAQCTIEHLIKYSPRPPQTITATNRLHCSTTDNGFVHDQQKKNPQWCFFSGHWMHFYDRWTRVNGIQCIIYFHALCKKIFMLSVRALFVVRLWVQAVGILRRPVIYLSGVPRASQHHACTAKSPMDSYRNKNKIENNRTLITTHYSNFF